MAALFARVGNFRIHSNIPTSCLKTLRISTKANTKTLYPCNRSYFTTGVTRRSSFGMARISGVHIYNGAKHGLFPWTQSARYFSVSSRSSSYDNTETMQDDKVTNPFLQENLSGSTLDSMSTGSEMLRDMADTHTLASVAEPSMTSLGLGGWMPPGIIQQCLELTHIYGNLSWCASICLVTVVLRVFCLPLVIRAQKNSAKLNNIKPQMEELQLQMREMTNSQDSTAQAHASMKLKQLYQENDCHPMKSISAILVQGPLFVSFFFAVRGMAYLPVESFKTGGYLWFQDLTLFDPYFVLPIICSFSMLASLELGTDVGISNPAMKSLKTFMRIFAVVLIPLTAYFPAAMFCYWVTSNLLTCLQVGLLKHPAIRTWLGIPEMVKFESKLSGGFIENMKAGYKSSQQAAHIKHAEKMKVQRQKALGDAPLEPTYEFNPRIKENQETFSLLNDDENHNKRRIRRRKEQQKKVKYNQQFFSAKTHQKAKSGKV